MAKISKVSKSVKAVVDAGFSLPAEYVGRIEIVRQKPMTNKNSGQEDELNNVKLIDMKPVAIMYRIWTSIIKGTMLQYPDLNLVDGNGKLNLPTIIKISRHGHISPPQ